ncbi:(2Fe-2S) ferredoxin domain-containing protein [Methylomarinum sp. Ch1-1]|uniref:(2Fe-2S) ferredoxin domain-containing protein n=1 Tax=Methylomarinum roseum TaxID=3067653 RepID=A0AAU7NTX5_9GAMM|nr:(2Fe-2S) ferredoxin domain-containing protein [Methylomarinum sp. Ch1-1]MDP4519565.1 (2Fe-2S) ferredoxin domain-containing protein [Methylomarinum sp. Ch1-1]
MKEVMKPSMRTYKRHVLVCVGSKCTENGEGQILYDALKDKLKKAGLGSGELRVERSRVNCLGTCKSGPLLCVHPDGVWYYGIDSDKLDIIIEQHLKAGKPVTEWVYHQGPNCEG